MDVKFKNSVPNKWTPVSETHLYKANSCWYYIKSCEADPYDMYNEIIIINNNNNNNNNDNNNNLYCRLPLVMVHNKWIPERKNDDMIKNKYSGPSFRVPGMAIVIVRGRLDVFNINTILDVIGDYVISSQSSWPASQHPPFNIHLAHNEDVWGPLHFRHLYM